MDFFLTFTSLDVAPSYPSTWHVSNSNDKGRGLSNLDVAECKIFVEPDDVNTAKVLLNATNTNTTADVTNTDACGGGGDNIITTTTTTTTTTTNNTHDAKDNNTHKSDVDNHISKTTML
uniref:Uncharacterized protein n=1 Tax=Lygus hesperus TaxID=30085 RepID=A0A0A9VYU3_LYGHE